MVLGSGGRILSVNWMKFGIREGSVLKNLQKWGERQSQPAGSLSLCVNSLLLFLSIWQVLIRIQPYLRWAEGKWREEPGARAKSGAVLWHSHQWQLPQKRVNLQEQAAGIEELGISFYVDIHSFTFLKGLRCYFMRRASITLFLIRINTKDSTMSTLRNKLIYTFSLPDTLLSVEGWRTAPPLEA